MCSPFFALFWGGERGAGSAKQHKKMKGEKGIMAKRIGKRQITRLSLN